MKPNLDKIKEILQVLKEDTITPKELEYFVIQILGTIKNEREKFENISQEQVDKIDKAVISIEEKAIKASNFVDTKISKTKFDFIAEIEKIKNLLEVIKNIKSTPGKPGKNGITPIKGKDYFDGYTPIKGEDYFTEYEVEELKESILKEIPKEELLGEDIVDKINELDTTPENQIDAKHIKNLPTTKQFIGGGGGSSGYSGDLYDSNNNIIATVLNGAIKTVVYPSGVDGVYATESGDYYLTESGDYYSLE